MNRYTDLEFERIISPVLEIEEFNQLKFITHHGITRYDHSMRVAYLSYKVCKALHLDYKEVTIAALLHDTVEDTTVTFEMLEKEFPACAAVEAIKLLTRDKAVPYLDYVKNLKSNPIARKVKLADLRHNSDMSRLPNPTEKDWKRKEKYEKAIQILIDDCEN